MFLIGPTSFGVLKRRAKRTEQNSTLDKNSFEFGDENFETVLSSLEFCSHLRQDKIALSRLVGGIN